MRASARDAAALEAPGGVEAVELDVTAPDPAVLRGVRTVFLYPVFGPVDDFLKAADEAGVEHLVLLSSPASYEPVEHAGPIGRAHQAVEASLRESGLSHTVLYPSWLATNAIRDWAEAIRATGRVGIAHPRWQVNPIHIDDIAEVAARLLTRDEHRGRTLVLTGPESMPQREVVARLAEAIGRPIAVDELSREEATARLPEWFPEPVFASLLDVAEAAGDTPATINNNVERLTGHPARSFRAWAEAERDAFTAR
ncbi:NAD(P)H-binding protein [Glycomyces tenuis]|uniref:NAD(P)H-binding protein n=1 Tax=Glycomyces tenuis TaxID=58116 RepID=UPI000AD674F7|nr:NAD(P)H-binding protein [Glycomyces tenuis]